MGRDIVREIADDGELLREDLLQFELEEVAFHQPTLHPLEVREKVVYAFRVYLNEPKVYVLPFQQILG